MARVKDVTVTERTRVIVKLQSGTGQITHNFDEETAVQLARALAEATDITQTSLEEVDG